MMCACRQKINTYVIFWNVNELQKTNKQSIISKHVAKHGEI